jgi:hypothetical protein
MKTSMPCVLAVCLDGQIRSIPKPAVATDMEALSLPQADLLALQLCEPMGLGQPAELVRGN